ncbi:ribokinase [Lentibacillus halodurans]|uniref:Deoxyribokinase n=1 Tax=Lentibacillus halodurans TaxID=237679 RepID=A0A1I0YG77_9BACI|nr:ribokinase [Lentibacillus halodurans]SFB11786.1 ribokinase [Lentibacillus halodurans]
MGILVIGSFMMDLVVVTPRAPENGETIIGSKFSRFPGGKGANQAVSASRLGGSVTMAGKIGKDQFGNEAIRTLQDEQINTKYIKRDSQKATGIGVVTIEENGHNRIIVVPGANLDYDTENLREIEALIKKTDILVIQLEMDLNMIEQAVMLASKHMIPIILNPAPAQKLSDHMLNHITYLTPNETEAEILTGISITTREDAKDAAEMLLDKGVKNVILTLAEEGALIVNKYGKQMIPGFTVGSVDSVAAGDAFNGALAVGITEGKPLNEVVRYANAVGALTVTKEGAIPSLPTSEDVMNFILKLKGHDSR